MNNCFRRIVMCFCIINICNVTVIINGEVDVDTPEVDDSILSEMSFKDKFNLHHAFVAEKLKWKSGVVSFKIDRAFDEYEITSILIAMYEIERNSCIRFVAHDPSQGPTYVMIKKHNDPERCESAVGFLNKGEQLLNLGAQCSNIAIIVHELLHTIGFQHHHQRSDRDKYIAIHTENVIASESYNFKRKTNYDKRIKYLTPFDFKSVMLYNEYAYTKNNKPVITPKIEGAKIQPPTFNLSKYDSILLNRFYNCKFNKKKSKIFYESENDDNGLAFPPIINYHEIARAKEYLLDDDEGIEFTTEKNEENQKTDEEQEQEEKSIVTAQQEENQKTDEESNGQEEKSQFTAQQEENQKTDEESTGQEEKLNVTGQQEENQKTDEASNGQEEKSIFTAQQEENQKTDEESNGQEEKSQFTAQQEENQKTDEESNGQEEKSIFTAQQEENQKTDEESNGQVEKAIVTGQQEENQKTDEASNGQEEKAIVTGQQEENQKTDEASNGQEEKSIFTAQQEENQKTDEESTGQEEKLNVTGQQEENFKTDDDVVKENEQDESDQESKNYESTNFV